MFPRLITAAEQCPGAGSPAGRYTTGPALPAPGKGSGRSGASKSGVDLNPRAAEHLPPGTPPPQSREAGPPLSRWDPARNVSLSKELFLFRQKEFKLGATTQLGHPVAAALRGH